MTPCKTVNKLVKQCYLQFSRKGPRAIVIHYSLFTVLRKLAQFYAKSDVFTWKVTFLREKWRFDQLHSNFPYGFLWDLHGWGRGLPGGCQEGCPGAGCHGAGVPWCHGALLPIDPWSAIRARLSEKWHFQGRKWHFQGQSQILTLEPESDLYLGARVRSLS